MSAFFRTFAALLMLIAVGISGGASALHVQHGAAVMAMDAPEPGAHHGHAGMAHMHGNGDKTDNAEDPQSCCSMMGGACVGVAILLAPSALAPMRPVAALAYRAVGSMQPGLDPERTPRPPRR